MQTHRNNNYRRNNYRPQSQSRMINFFRTGQIFSVIYQISLLVLIYILVEKGQSDLALKVFEVNAGIILIAFIISKIERSIFNSSKRSRYNNRRRSQNSDRETN